MRVSHRSLMGAQEPALQQARHTVGAWQEVLSNHRRLARHLMPITSGGQRAIAVPSVGEHLRSVFHTGFHGAPEHHGRGVGDADQPNASDKASVGLGYDQHQCLAVRPAPAFAGPFTANVHLIHFDGTGQPVSPRSHHGPAQFVQPTPGRRVADAHDPLQPQGAGSILLLHHMPHRFKPQTQRQVGVGKERADGHSKIITAVRTSEERWRQGPHLGLRTARAPWTVGPADLLQIRPAGGIVREPRPELPHRTRIVGHAIHYP